MVECSIQTSNLKSRRPEPQIFEYDQDYNSLFDIAKSRCANASTSKELLIAQQSYEQGQNQLIGCAVRFTDLNISEGTTNQYLIEPNQINQQKSESIQDSGSLESDLLQQSCEEYILCPDGPLQDPLALNVSLDSQNVSNTTIQLQQVSEADESDEESSFERTQSLKNTIYDLINLDYNEKDGIIRRLLLEQYKKRGRSSPLSASTQNQNNPLPRIQVFEIDVVTVQLMAINDIIQSKIRCFVKESDCPFITQDYSAETTAPDGCLTNCVGTEDYLSISQNLRPRAPDLNPNEVQHCPANAPRAAIGLGPTHKLRDCIIDLDDPYDFGISVLPFESHCQINADSQTESTEDTWLMDPMQITPGIEPRSVYLDTLKTNEIVIRCEAGSIYIPSGDTQKNIYELQMRVNDYLFIIIPGNKIVRIQGYF